MIEKYYILNFGCRNRVGCEKYQLLNFELGFRYRVGISKACWCDGRPNVGWGGVADGRGQSWLILGKFKIQINPINLTFPGGRKFMMQSYMQHPGCWSLCIFAIYQISKKTRNHDIWNHRRNIHQSVGMNLPADYSCPLRNWYLSKLQSVFLQFRDWYLSKVQFAWEQCHL